MAIDSHMHINKLLITDVFKEIQKINDNIELSKVINVGLNLDTSKESIFISKNNAKFYSSVGIHPLYINNQNIIDLYELSLNDKVIAIGEIGLDNLKDNLDIQKIYLKKQINIANENKLPIIIHSNNMNKEVIKIFKNDIKPKYGCVFHCFQPDMDDLEYLIKSDYYVSFAGRITYKTAKRSIEVIKKVPNDLFLVETDSPYITPEPYRNKINHSSNLNLIIEKIAAIKRMNYDEIENITMDNAKILFKKLR